MHKNKLKEKVYDFVADNIIGKIMFPPDGSPIYENNNLEMIWEAEKLIRFKLLFIQTEIISPIQQSLVLKKIF